jgi:hypothetical protein
MSKPARSIGTVTLDDECVTRTVEVLQEELQIPYLDIYQK